MNGLTLTLIFLLIGVGVAALLKRRSDRLQRELEADLDRMEKLGRDEQRALNERYAFVIASVAGVKLSAKRASSFGTD